MSLTDTSMIGYFGTTQLAAAVMLISLTLYSLPRSNYLLYIFRAFVEHFSGLHQCLCFVALILHFQLLSRRLV